MRSNDSVSCDLLANYPPLVGVRLNIAISATGKVAGSSGSSNDVSNPLDRSLLVELRRLSDVILTTGLTARAEGIRRSKHAPIVIVTNAASIEGYSDDLLKPQIGNQGLFFVTLGPQARDIAAALSSHGSDAEVVSLDSLSPREVLTTLKNLGFAKFLLEFGPKTSTLWLHDRAIDEVCLTTTGLSHALQENHVNFAPQWLNQGSSLKIISSFVSEKYGSVFQRIAVNNSQD